MRNPFRRRWSATIVGELSERFTDVTFLHYWRRRDAQAFCDRMNAKRSGEEHFTHFEVIKR